MHNAPPVVYPVGRFAWGLPLAVVLAFMAAAVLMLWWVWSSASALACAGLAGVWCGAATCAVVLGRREFVQQGALAWDGEQWQGCGISDHDGPVQLTLTLDWGHGMLVACRAQAPEAAWPRTRHACLRRADMPSRWHGFRCAVYSRRAAQVGVA
ncbi:MAG: hypothetical protein RI998_299 [Pseudomonadota bacterium]|jgi:hypothetical protein